jgi:hypothetical protein
MPDDKFPDDTEIIRAAYAEKVGEAFKIFAEKLAVGQNEISCMDQFRRSVLWARKARDLTLNALSGGGIDSGASETGLRPEIAAEPLSAEDQALVDQVLAGTTGAAPPPPVRGYRGR